jgi:hypothetical protein
VYIDDLAHRFERWDGLAERLLAEREALNHAA